MKALLHISMRTLLTALGVFALASPAQAALQPETHVIVMSAPVIEAPMIVSETEKLAQRTISASEAKSIAMNRVRGAKFVDVSRQGSVYRVRLIRPDGRVVDVFVDAATGRVRN